MWYVYLLLCDRKTFYVGMTHDVYKRVYEHRTGQSFFTKKFSELDLVYCEKYPTLGEAVSREKQFKGWGHAKKQKLVDGVLGRSACPEIVEELSRGREVDTEQG